MIVIMECTAILAEREGCAYIVQECQNKANLLKSVGDLNYLLITEPNEQLK